MVIGFGQLGIVAKIGMIPFSPHVARNDCTQDSQLALTADDVSASFIPNAHTAYLGIAFAITL